MKQICHHKIGSPVIMKQSLVNSQKKLYFSSLLFVYSKVTEKKLVFIKRKIYKNHKNTIKTIPKFMLSFALTKTGEWARLESSPGLVWSPGCMFNNLALDTNLAHTQELLNC